MENLLPKFPEFFDMTLGHQKVFDRFFSKYKPEISEYTFTNLYVWRRARPIKFSFLDDQLCIMAQKGENSFYFMPPVGEGDICKTAELLFNYAKEKNVRPSLQRVPEGMAKTLMECGFPSELDIDNSDYIYLVDDLATLSGRKFDGKRNRIKKCISENNPEYYPMTSDIVELCLELQTSWCNIRQCKLDSGLDSEDTAIKEIFSLMDILPVFGGVIFINGKIEAFTVAEKLNDNTAVIHFEKANPEIDGLYQLINYWFCQNALRDYIYVNREQDLGIDGLRRAKQSYYPHRMLNKYTINPIPQQ